MSSLEERREARRRRRQQEEELLEQEKTRSLSRDDVKRVIDSRLAQRRLERKNKRAESPQVNDSNNLTTTEEDEGERRRRERRESRLRQDQERSGEADSSATEERSSRRNRRRGGDEEEESSSAPEPAAESEPEPSAAPAADDEVDSAAADREREAVEQRKREEEEDRAAEAERQRQAEEERRKRQDEDRKAAEEKRKKKTPRTPRTPRHERQSRSKNRTPRGPLQTPRSARQQTSSLFGAPSEQTIQEEDKKAGAHNTTTPIPQFSDFHDNTDLNTKSQNKKSIDKTESRRISSVSEKKESETKSNPGKRAIPNHDSVTDLYAKIDVKAKIKALEAERNKHLFSYSPKGMDDGDECGNDAKRYDANEERISTPTKRMAEETMTGERGGSSSEQSPSAKRLRSLQSSSDTDFDDRLTDIVATNREMLAHDDTIERFTDFELGSCSSYDDIFQPKDQKNRESSVPKIDLMGTHEFTPDFHCNDVFQSTDSLVESQTIQNKQATDSLLEPPLPATQSDKVTSDGSSDPQPLKSILKVKTQDEQHHRESSINRHKARSSAKERDLRRSSSRSRTRAPPRTPSSETSSDDNDHFIPFTVDTEEVIYNPEKRRASALEEKAVKLVNNNNNNNIAKNRLSLSPRTTPGVESMSENESMFSGDDVSSTRNSYSVGTSFENLENLDSDYGELMSANTTLTATADDDFRESIVKTPTPFTGHGHTVTLNDTTDNFVSTAILISPEVKHQSDVDKIKDSEQRDSDNSQDSLESSLESSGFAGVKSDIPFNAKKKKINARRSGRISQMTSIWSKMPDSKEDVHKETIKSSSVDPPRQIFVITSARGEPEQQEELTQDSSVTRHKSIDTRMTELQQQLHQDESSNLQTAQTVPTINVVNKEVKTSKHSTKTLQEDPHRYSEAKKKQLDELFGKLNSKLKSKEHHDDYQYQKVQYSDRQAPIFLAPFDSSVDAMQRSQSQPILNTNEEMEYYDPSQSVREYICWDDESPNKTPEPHSLDYQMDEEEEEGEEREREEEEEGDEVRSNKAQCSSGDSSSRLGSSSVSNWSARSNIGSGSNPDDYSDSDGGGGHEEYSMDVREEEEIEIEDGAPPETLMKVGRSKAFVRKESAFSIKSNVSEGSFHNNTAGYIVGDIPDEEEVFERDAHTNEWLHEDVGYRQASPYHPSSNNFSTLSNADSTSVVSVDSMGDESEIDEGVYYVDDHQYHDVVMPAGERSPGEILDEEAGMQLVPELREGGGDDFDLKLPLHFLNDSSPDDEEDVAGSDEGGEFDSDKCMDGSASDPGNYGYSSDNYEEGGLDSSRIVEYGDEYFHGEEVDGGGGGGDGEHEYFHGEEVDSEMHCSGGGNGERHEHFAGEQRDVDVIDSMEGMGEDILQYLSDEMDDEGEVEEWGEEEVEEEEVEEEDVADEGNLQVDQPQRHDGGGGIVGASSAEEDDGIVYYTPNSGGGGGGGGVVTEQLNTEYVTAEQTQLDLRQMIHDGNDIMSRNESDGYDNNDDDDGDYDEIRKDFNYNADMRMNNNNTGITESARRREMFKEHHGHIDDKDIVHCDNLPHGQELPDNDEFFLSFEYDEEHCQGIHQEYSEESEGGGAHDVEIPPLDTHILHSAHFEEYESQSVETAPLRPNIVRTTQCVVESEGAESSEDLHTSNFVEPQNMQIAFSSHKTVEDLHVHQRSEFEILQSGEETKKGFNAGHFVHPSSFIPYPTDKDITDEEERSFLDVVTDADTSQSPKSNRSSIEDSEISPELKKIRKKLVSELKYFNPKSLRRTSMDESSSQSDAGNDTHSNASTISILVAPDTPQLEPMIRKSSLVVESNKIDNQTTTMSPIEQYIQTKQEPSIKIEIDNTDNTTMTTPQVHVNNSSVDTNQTMMQYSGTMDVRSKSISLEPGNATVDVVRLRRNSASSGGQDGGGVMSKERRRSIRSFWFQLDEDEKKQKENEQSWRKKRDENQHRSRERNIGRRPDGGSASNIWASLQFEQNCNESHQQLNASYNNIDAHISTKPPLSGSMQHLDLASNEKASHVVNNNDSQSYEKPRKKPPPAVAPKPRRKTTIGISFNPNSEMDTSKTSPMVSTSKPPKPTQTRTNSVKRIASFHEKQSEALQEKSVVCDKPKKQMIFPPPPITAEVSTNKNEESERKSDTKLHSFLEKQEIDPKPVIIDRPKSKMFSFSPSSNVQSGQHHQESPDSSSSNCEETIISARSEENRRAKIKKVESILIKRLSENSEIKETFKMTPPVAAKPTSAKTVTAKIATTEHGVGGFGVKSTGLNYNNQTMYSNQEQQHTNVPKLHTLFPQNHEEIKVHDDTESTNEHVHKLDSITPLVKPHLNLNAIISPFSLNLPLNPPTLEEIDVNDNDDLTEPSKIPTKETPNKQQLWIDHGDNKDSSKPQAPRPRFNAKALATSQNVLPAWAKKIEVKPIAPSPLTHSDLPPLQLSACGSGSTTSLDNVGNVSYMSGEMSSRDKEIKSWATDYIRDVISLDHHHPRGPHDIDSFGSKIASDSDSSFSANSSFYGHLPLHAHRHGGDKSFLSEGQSDPLSSRSSKSKESNLSVAERISKMQEKMEASKEVAKPLEKQNPTQSQKQFASLLQNRLIDVIAQEADDDKKERERERKKRKPRHPPPNSWAAERMRLFGAGKSVIKEESTWSPEQTSTPSVLSRQPTKLSIDVGPEVTDAKTSTEQTLEDATNKFEDLSQSLSQNEVIKMNKVRKREGRQYRRVTTGGINIAEMRDKFAAGTDSSGGSSTESSFGGTPKEKTRPNSPWISSSGAFPQSPLVSSVINKLTSAETTDTEGKSPVESREPSLSRSRGRVAERVRDFSSRENSLPNSRSSSRSRRDSEVISGTFDLKTVSELVRRVESSEESGTSLGSSLNFQPGELIASRNNNNNNNNNNESKLVSEVVRKLHSDQYSSSNSSPSSSLDRRTFTNVSAIKNSFSESLGVTLYQQNKNAIATPFRRLDEEECTATTTTTTTTHNVSQGLSQTVSALSDLQPSKKTVKNKRMDKDRRHTTQINFAELRERYSSMGHAKEARPPQSPALHAIYATSAARDFDSDSDYAATRRDSPTKDIQVARSSTFHKTKIETVKEKLGSLQNSNSTHNPQNNETTYNNSSSIPNPDPYPIERPKDFGFALSLNQQATTSTPHSSVATPGSLPVSARHHEGVEDDVFSPLSSARVPESLNLPSDVPPPILPFSATNYEDDMSHGELAESESSDTVDFVKKRYEERAVEREQQLQQQQQQYHQHLHQHQQQHQHQQHISFPTNVSSHQITQQHHHHHNEHNTQQQHHNHQHNYHHNHHHHQHQQHQEQQPSHHVSQQSIASSPPSDYVLGATAAAVATASFPPPRHYLSFPETIIDTKTATGHVRCRILSEVPADRDESGIGASDQSMGSNSTLSVSSVIQDRIPEAHSLNSTSSLPSNDQKQNRTIHNVRRNNVPDILLPDESQTDQQSREQIHSPPIYRKFSLGNESVSSIEERGATSLKFDEGLLSPRRATVHAIEQHGISTSRTVDTYSSNASLSPDSSRSKYESSNGLDHASSNPKHDPKRRKSKSKFMQDVMEKRRNKSEPNEHKSSHSRKKHLHSSSDLPSERRGSNGLFGTTVGGRKKSTGSPNGNDSSSANTMRGYSKRFDALWAKFDPEIQQKSGLEETSDTHGQSSSMQPDEAEEAERTRQEEERERERMEAEEAARVKAEEEQQKKKKGKRKGLGGLSAEKKKLLKKLIMQRAAEELRNEAKQKAAEKEKYINDRVAPLKTDGLGQSELQALVKDLHARVSTLEEDVYDWEIKIRKQDFEINELTLKVNDTKGKFIKPVLRKVNKTESKLKKIQVLKESTDFRGNLKSTGQNKYALEEDEADKNNPHWRDDLKPKAEEEAAAES